MCQYKWIPDIVWTSKVHRHESKFNTEFAKAERKWISNITKPRRLPHKMTAVFIVIQDCSIFSCDHTFQVVQSLLFNYFQLCVVVWLANGCVGMSAGGVLEASGPLELELHMVGSLYLVAGTQNWVYQGKACSLNH